jgi:hypothetical protein
LNCGEGLPEE